MAKLQQPTVPYAPPGDYFAHVGTEKPLPTPCSNRTPRCPSRCQAECLVGVETMSAGINPRIGGLARPFARSPAPGPAGNAQTPWDNSQNRPGPLDRPRPFASHDFISQTPERLARSCSCRDGPRKLSPTPNFDRNGTKAFDVRAS